MPLPAPRAAVYNYDRMTRRMIALLTLHLVLACAGDVEPLRVAVPQSALPLVTDLVFQQRARDSRARVEVRAVPDGAAALGALRAGEVDAAVVISDPATTHDAALTEHVLARTPLAFGINVEANVTALTRRQLCDVYTGRVANWRELGGSDVPVRAGVRPPVPGDAGNPVALLDCPPGFRFGPRVQMIEGSPGIAMSAIAGTRGAIGITPVDAIDADDGSHSDVRLVAVDSIAPTVESVAHGAYPIARRVSLLTGNPTPDGVARLLSFARTAEGRRIIRAAGAIPAGGAGRS